LKNLQGVSFEKSIEWRTIAPVDELPHSITYLVDKIGLNSGSNGSSLTQNLTKTEAIGNPLPQTKPRKRPTHLQFGYQKTSTGLTTHAGEQQVIQQILAYRANGLSFKKIAAQMTAMGVITKSGQTKWHPMNVKRILDSFA
jgi:hypothetical protein